MYSDTQRNLLTSLLAAGALPSIFTQAPFPDAITVHAWLIIIASIRPCGNVKLTRSINQTLLMTSKSRRFGWMLVVGCIFAIFGKLVL